jgi:anaerobic magnesium-protoporphyrin IX monomethyl ester cyclase
VRPPRVLLLFLPPADPAQPYSSLPTLSAFLRARGCDVTMADLNIEAVHHLLRAENLRACGQTIRQWISGAEANGLGTPTQVDHYLNCVAALGFADVAPTAVPHAIDRLRQQDTYASAGRFVESVDVVDRAFQLVSAVSHPTVVSRHGLAFPHDIWDPAELARAIDAAEASPVTAWLTRRIGELVDRHSPDLVGVSLTFADQLVPSLLALRAVRAVDPTIHTCLGGVTATRLAKRLGHLGPLLSLIDSVVAGEGEHALAELALRAADGSSPEGIANVIWRGPDGELRRGPSSTLNHMNELPLPAYDELDLKTYLVPEPVLIVNSSRACYWGRCSFCDVSGTASETYRQRTIERVVEDMAQLRERTGARHFIFGDLSMSPRRLDRLAAAVVRRGLDVHWLCEARLEEGFTAAVVDRLAVGGCRGLVFGLESASQRMLDRMDKGTAFKHTEPILERCAKANISVNLQAFIGFPGETEDEARETVRFCVGQKSRVTSVSMTSFKLIEGTAAYENASQLGMARLRQRQQPRSLDALWDFDSEIGMSRARTRELLGELHAELQAAYPIIRKGLSWNAHALLLVSRSGPDGLRLPREGSTPAGHGLRLRPGLRIVRLPFHVAKLASAMRAGDPKGLRRRGRPRPKSNGGSLERKPTWTVLDESSGRVIALDDCSYELVRSLGGEAKEPDASSAPTGGLNGAAVLLRLVRQGILVPRPACHVIAEEIR